MTRTFVRAAQFSTMTREEFRELRMRLGYSQSQLASVLGYSTLMRISEMERATNPRPVPWVVGQLMRAMDQGFVPDSVDNPFG